MTACLSYNTHVNLSTNIEIHLLKSSDAAAVCGCLVVEEDALSVSVYVVYALDNSALAAVLRFSCLVDSVVFVFVFFCATVVRLLFSRTYCTRKIPLLFAFEFEEGF